MASDQGNRSDYALGTREGWDAFDVVRFHACEGLSELFCYDIVLARQASRGPVALDALVGTPATFRVATEARWRPVHGLVTEAELVSQTESILLYRVILEPHAVVARHRRRCRTFVDKTLLQIVGEALAGLTEVTDAPAPPPEAPQVGDFTHPKGAFRWALADAERARSPRRFVVQYNESDLAFAARLLEAEGLSFFFEHGAEVTVLSITDRPGHAHLFARDARHELVANVIGGAAQGQEVVRAFRPRERLRSGRVVMRDYAWRRSRTRLEAAVDSPAPLALEHYEYPARDEDEPSRPGAAPASFQLERFEAERQLSEGVSTVRTHEPGYRFRLINRAGLQDERELLVVRAETWAQQLFFEGAGLEPFESRSGDEPFFETRFEAVPASGRYRPARSTPKPQIAGLQTARVTAEELGPSDGGVELNSDELGRVRVRFPWDQREPDGTPSSKWVRVAHFWAGPGFGAMYVPRVGHEVLVAFEQGDPDRPIVVGRLYNAQNPPPYVEPNTTKSTLKSDSVGVDGASADGFNEFRFDDAADKEQVFLHAQRNLDEVVRASHSTTVGGAQTNTVGADQKNTVYGSRTHHVHGTETVTVEGDRTTYFNASELHQVAAGRTTGIGADDAHAIGGNHALDVGGQQSIAVGGNRSVTVGAAHVVQQVAYLSHAHASHAFTSPTFSADQSALIQMRSGGDIKATAAAQLIAQGGSAKIMLSSGVILIDNGAGASISLCGAMIAVNSGVVVDSTGARHLASSAATTVTSGGATNIAAGGDVNASGSTIKLNG